MDTSNTLPPVTIIRHEPPEALGTCGVIATAIAGSVIGEVWRYIDTDGTISHAGQHNHEDLRRGAWDAEIIDDAEVWNAFAAVAPVIRDELRQLDATN